MMEAKKLTHVDDAGRARMVDITEKAPSDRQAVARGRVRMSRETLELVASGGAGSQAVALLLLAVAQMCVAGAHLGARTDVILDSNVEPVLDTAPDLDLVRQVKPHTNGECFLVLDSGAQVKVSRSYRDVVARFVH